MSLIEYLYAIRSFLLHAQNVQSIMYFKDIALQLLNVLASLI